MIIFRCWSDGDGSTPRWWNEGETITRGRYWYECREGRLEPRGCMSKTSQKLNIGEEVEDGEYVAVCELGPDGHLRFRFTACIGSENRHYNPGEQWIDSQNIYYYECEQDGAYLRNQIKGCISHDKQRKILIGQQDDYGDYIYECREKYNGSIQMCSVGCINNGQHYKIGDQWPEGEFLYYCKSNGGRSQKVCIGCLYQNKRLYDGDRFRDQDTVYECEIRPDSYGHKPVGCLAKDLDGSVVERVIGCRWYLQDSQSKIEQTCEVDGTKTKVRTTACIYRHNGFDTIFLLPGQYTIWSLPVNGKSVGIACRENPDGPKLDVFDVSQVAQYTTGLSYEQPRGK
ncbi:hypothetical protein DICVIV_02427 [Dictyocaulus viviparus]|uniref:Abnormal cell migration protein 18-like fibronectin type I domain-containing protein n=1 Tax=Dictyocaulus viviparus TaxID=29172 RepID=A0A0D8Y3H2_DICVI|nr:hypothetical protein DICVIV_02427 [Dictyocaulus viviparus]